MWTRCIMTSGEEMANIQLVREVQKHPVLYNYRLPDYSKRELVEAAWIQIAQKMNDEAQMCKEKWRNLRTVFVRRLKPLPTGSTKRRKSYYLRDAMSFLTPFIKGLRSEEVTESTTSPVQSESENVTVSDEPDHNEYDDGDNATQPESSYDAVHRNKLRIHPPSPGYDQPKRVLTRKPSESVVSPEYYKTKRARHTESDESRKYFLLSLLPEVQKLTDNQMKYFRRKMLDALDEAEACPAYSRRPRFCDEDTIENGAHGVTYFNQFSPKRES